MDVLGLKTRVACDMFDGPGGDGVGRRRGSLGGSRVHKGGVGKTLPSIIWSKCARKAVFEMRVGLSLSEFRIRQQTGSGCGGKEPPW